MVLRYLEYALTVNSQETAKRNQSILNSIHPDLKFEILREIYTNIFKKTQGFKEFPSSVLDRLAQHAEELSFSPGQDIIDEHDHEEDKSLFYVEKGVVLIYLKDSDTYLKELASGAIFGEFAFFTGCKRTSSVKAKDYVNVVRFKRGDLLNKINALGRELLVKFNYKVALYGDLSIFDITCYSCRGKNHPAKSCKYTHLEMNKRNLIRFKKVETNIRKKFVRNNKRQFAAIYCQLEIESARIQLCQLEGNQNNPSKQRSGSYSEQSEGGTSDSPGSPPMTASHRRKNTKKRRSQRKTKRQTVMYNNTLLVDKVNSQGNTYFYEEANIDKFCKRFNQENKEEKSGKRLHSTQKTLLQNEKEEKEGKKYTSTVLKKSVGAVVGSNKRRGTISQFVQQQQQNRDLSRSQSPTSPRRINLF